MATNTCIQQWARLDPDGFVQPGTMQGFRPDKAIPCGMACEWVKLKTSQYTIPEGCTQCRHPQGLRFFYQLTKNGSILPNSLIMSNEFPASPGSCSFWIEWKKICCA